MKLERVSVLSGTSKSGKTSCLNQLNKILEEKAYQTVLINKKYVKVSTQGYTK
ncbi:hypothetical protein [Halarcobacter sp.]|uniref:hypothetical protein n=1 Tax=Halarcobacter sp. TaxID=2321133 RepID=UPI003A8F9979